jgi:S-adenosylmethionine:tRNA ribosyltransferase-isomerase
MIRKARELNRQVVAVGTSAVRLIEAASQSGEIQPYCGQVNLFILPGYQFRMVDAMITNFHLPKSTLIMLVSAFAGKEFIFEAYKEAMNQDYRFYSFGDAMLIR